MTFLRPLALAALCAAALAIPQTIAAQETRAGAELKKLAVTVFFDEQRFVGPFDVLENAPGDGRSAEISPLSQIKGWKRPEGKPPPTSVRLKVSREGDAVRIKVSLVFDDTWPPEASGPKYGAREQTVGAYLVREGETVGVEELKSFGVEPFSLAVSEAKPEPEMPFAPAPARATSSLKSIEVVSFLTEGEQMERGRLVVRNVSEKNVVALEIKVKGHSQTAYRADPRPLIESGATYETWIYSGRSVIETPNGLDPEPRPDALVVDAVVFADGSYEGDVRTAASMFASQKGRSIQFERVMKLLQSALDSEGPDPSGALARLKSQIGGLRIDIEPSVVDEMLSKFPTLRAGDGGRRIIAYAAVEGLKTGKVEALALLGAIERARAEKAEGFDLRGRLEEMRGAIERRGRVTRD